jgi:molybdopterin molybdotransferase
MLVAMARDMGLEPPRQFHAEDRIEAILQRLEETADRQIVLLAGGVSVGTYDLVPQALSRYGAEVVFHRVSQKPGKPLLFGRKGDQLIFGLPGNPLASHFCFHRYVAAAVRRSQGKHPVAQAVLGELTRSVQPKRERTYFVAAVARRDMEAESTWKVHPSPGTSSADIFASAGANCYAELPPGETPVPAGETVRFTWLGDAPWPD